jgi:methionyl-tRNA formyltransferase
VRILLVAEESAGLQTLRMLLDGGYSVGGVLTSDSTSARGATVRDLARKANVPALRSDLVKDPQFSSWITEHDVDVLLNIHSLFLIHADIVASPRIGSFNLHPGPLPRYAGLNAPSWAIYHGETTHAVTLHWMEPEIDTGAVAYAAVFDLSGEDTGLSVSAKCVRHGLPLVNRLLETAERDQKAIPATEQDLEHRRYFGREAPQDGKLQWSRPAREVVRFVRAADYAPFPSPWGHPVARFEGDCVGIAKAALTGRPTTEAPGSITEAQDGGVDVATGDEWVTVRRLEVDGKYVRAEEVLTPGLPLGDG